MGRLSRVASALISAIFSILLILFLYGYLTPIGLDPQKILGFDFASVFQTYGMTGSTASPYAALIPGGATGLILFQVLSRVGRSVTSVTRAATMPSPDDMMRKMNFPNMMGMMNVMGPQNMPANLPADITRSQFVVLRCYRQGLKNPGDIGKSLSMDGSAIETETSVLTTNGYLTKDKKLTTKAMELIGA